MPELGRDIVPYRYSRDIEPRVDRQLVRLLGATYHRRFAPAVSPWPAWANYSSQRHVRDIAVDNEQDRAWLATWGGVICWSPNQARCIRHTSEHGLCGNATRCLEVDRSGTVWAAGQDGGLSSLNPSDGRAWQCHKDLHDWTVLRLVSDPGAEGGVYLALRHHDGSGALAKLTAPTAHLQILAQGGSYTRDIVALLPAHGGLYTGNPSGLHHVGHDGENPFDPGEVVRALTSAQGGGLWVGTNRGLLRIDGHPPLIPTRAPDWPRDEVLCLAADGSSGALWVATVREVGRVVDDGWESIAARPPGHLNVLFPDPAAPKERIWAGGSQGLLEITSTGDAIEAFFPDLQDGLSNAVQCLCAAGSDLWVGTARGLLHFDGQQWHRDRAPGLQDVRAIVPRPSHNEVWVAAWRGGLHCLEEAVHIGGVFQDQPVVALARGSDDSLWAATDGAIYHLAPDSQEWVPLAAPAREQISGAVIQSLCCHLVTGTGGERVPLLWVGTSAGLFCYRPGPGLWDPGEWDLSALGRRPIRTLVLDPVTNRVWAGTRDGLFAEHQRVWNQYMGGEVQSLAFGSDGTLWAGRRTGLERWLPPGDNPAALRKPSNVYRADSSGLAASKVTALAVQATERGQEVWAGSLAGLSRLQTWKEK